MKIDRIFKIVLKALLPVCAVVAAVHLLYSAWCGFSHHLFSFRDYGIYTHMIWNCAHGDFFRFALDQSYLSIHLSFTLALLGPLFYLTEHPFLLALIQWLMLMGGGALLTVAARRRNIPWEAAGAILFFFIAYRLTQSAMVKEFHGLATYFLLVPWLYYALCFRRKTAWLPLILILGVREDAFIFLLPMLGYMALKERDRTVAAMLAVSLVYGLLAIFVLYPWINGVSLFESRARFVGADAMGESIRHTLSSGLLAEGAHSTRLDALNPRLRALLLTLAPALLFLGRRGGLPVLLFPSAALLTALVSANVSQQTLGMHYGIAVAVMLSVGMVESLALKNAAATNDRRMRGTAGAVRACALAALVVLVHLDSGFIIGGGRHATLFDHTSPLLRLKLRAASRIPDSGLLLTEPQLSVYAATRKDLLILDLYDENDPPFDVAFLQMSTVLCWRDGWLYELYRRGELGAVYDDGYYVLLERGARSAPGIRLPQNLASVPILIALSLHHGGENGYEPGVGLYRYWEGDGSRGPINVCFGLSRDLEPGRYEAVFSCRARHPERTVRDSWGWVSVHEMDEPEPMARRDIPRMEHAPPIYYDLPVAFEIDRPTRVEPRVTGADAELWLDRVTFIRKP